MTNQQPHTPNISDFREDFVTACVHSYWLRADRARDYFNRELAAIEAAAEQRGAIKALRDAADDLEPGDQHESPYIKAGRDIIRTLRQRADYYHLQHRNDYDRLEGDDD